VKGLRYALATILLVAASTLGYVQVAHAGNNDPLNPACDQLTPTERAKSPTCNARTDENPLTGTNGLLMDVANIVALVAGIAAVIMIIVGGFRMITANGDAQGFASARSTVLGAIIGVIIIIAARSLVLLILERL